MLSHEPESGVKSGMMPWAKSQSTKSSRVMPGEVVPDEQHPERWQLLGERDRHRQPLLPPFPAASVLSRWQHLWLGGLARIDVSSASRKG